MRPIRSALLATLLGSLAGCTLAVTRSNPRPNLPFSGQTGRTLSMTISPEIKNDFTVPKEPPIPATEVTGWRESITAAFKNGFGDAFKLVPEGSPADLRLELLRADLEWAATAVSGKGGVAAVEAHVTYKANLVDSGGKSLGVATGTVASKKSIASAGEATACTASALESAFETITEKVLLPAIRPAN